MYIYSCLRVLRNTPLLTDDYMGLQYPIITIMLITIDDWAAGTSPPSSGSGGPSTAISVDGAKKLEMRKEMNKRQKSQRAKKTKDKKV